MSRPHSTRIARVAPERRPATALLLVLILSSLAAPAFAAKVYRCGNAFQDQPCPEVKVAAAQPMERSLVARDASACTASGRDGTGSGDCRGRQASNEPRAPAGQAKR